MPIDVQPMASQAFLVGDAELKKDQLPGNRRSSSQLRLLRIF